MTTVRRRKDQTMQRLLGILSFSLLAITTGCGSQESGKAAPPGKAGANPSRGTIGVSVLTLTNPFFKVIADGITEEARKHGYEVIVTSGEFDVARHSSGQFEFNRRGLGLGLALVKTFVEMHGGRVAVASTPGQGTTITVTLPPGS